MNPSALSKTPIPTLEKKLKIVHVPQKTNYQPCFIVGGLRVLIFAALVTLFSSEADAPVDAVNKPFVTESTTHQTIDNGGNEIQSNKLPHVIPCIIKGKEKMNAQITIDVDSVNGLFITIPICKEEDGIGKVTYVQRRITAFLTDIPYIGPQRIPIPPATIYDARDTITVTVNSGTKTRTVSADIPGLLVKAVISDVDIRRAVNDLQGATAGCHESEVSLVTQEKDMETILGAMHTETAEKNVFFHDRMLSKTKK